MANPFVGYDNIVCFLAPQDIASTATTCPYVDLRNALKASFLIQFGAVTSATATDYYRVTVQCATAEGGTEAAINFRYRLSGAVGANTWGAITTADSTGVDVTATDDNKILLVEPILQEMGEDDQYLSVLLSPGASMSALLVGAHAVQYSRYPQLNHVSAT